jgi:hypothetical protein
VGTKNIPNDDEYEENAQFVAETGTDDEQSTKDSQSSSNLDENTCNGNNLDRKIVVTIILT